MNKNILRWVAMPFAAIIGSIIAYLFVSLWIRGNNYGFEVYNGVEVGSITQIILSIAAQAVFGFTFVLCGAYVAPAYNRNCAIVLSTVISMISIVSEIISLSQNGFLFMPFIHTIATIVGSIIGARYVFDEN